MHRAIRSLILVAFLLGSAPLVARAEPPSGGPPGPPGMMRHGMRSLGDMTLGDGPGMILPLMVRHADLTPAQQQRVQEILSADRERLHTLFQQLDAANDALAAKVVGPGPVDAAALQRDVQAVARLRQDLMEQGLKTALAVRAVLTPEQLAKTAETQSKLRALQMQMRDLLDGK